MGTRRIVVAAVLGFLASWLAAKALIDVPARFSDVPLYRSYGEAMANGDIPYRDQTIEYPPGALPLFFIPAVVSTSAAGFAWVFEILLALCGVALVLATSVTLRALDASLVRLASALAFFAVTPLLLGRVAFERYDLWPTALLAVGLAFYVRGRSSLAGVAIGLGAAAKLFPALVLPVLAVSIWRRNGGREAISLVLSTVASFLLCLAPFVILAPDTLGDVFTRQLRRPLQIETLGASLLIAAHHAFGLSLGITSSFGSINLGGDGPALVGGVLTVASTALIVCAWSATGISLETATLSAALAVTALVTFGKVLSPQFIVWLIPVVVIVGGRSGVAATGMLSVAMVVTNILSPSHFLGLMRYDAGPSLALLSRNLVLVCLVATVAHALWRRRRLESGEVPRST